MSLVLRIAQEVSIQVQIEIQIQIQIQIENKLANFSINNANFKWIIADNCYIDWN